MPPLRPPAVLLAACLALAGCSPGPDGGTGATRGDSSSTAAVVPQPPGFTGRRELVVRAGLAVVGDGTCAPEPHRVCSSDGHATYVPIGRPARATLVEAGTELSADHTSWTAWLRFSPDSRGALARARRTAAAAGGLVLVLTSGREVLLAVPHPQVAGRAATYTGLDKREAWDLVGIFDR